MVDEAPTTKRCPKCEQIKPLDGFHRCRTRPDGRNVYCRECMSAWAKAHYRKKSPEARAKLVERTRELRRAHGPAYYAKHHQRVRENLRRWRERHHETANARIAAWAKANPEKRVAREARRRAKKTGAGGQFTTEDIAAIYKAQNGKCAYCRVRLGKKHHIDHIKPISKLGTSNPRNLQLTCASCNARKHAMDPLDFARKLGRLL